MLSLLEISLKSGNCSNSFFDERQRRSAGFTHAQSNVYALSPAVDIGRHFHLEISLEKIVLVDTYCIDPEESVSLGLS